MSIPTEGLATKAVEQQTGVETARQLELMLQHACFPPAERYYFGAVFAKSVRGIWGVASRVATPTLASVASHTVRSML
jgi:hypothetical protein